MRHLFSSISYGKVFLSSKQISVDGKASSFVLRGSSFSFFVVGGKFRSVYAFAVETETTQRKKM